MCCFVSACVGMDDSLRYSQQTNAEHGKQQLLLAFGHVESVDHAHGQKSSRTVSQDVDSRVSIPIAVSPLHIYAT